MEPPSASAASDALRDGLAGAASAAASATNAANESTTDAALASVAQAPQALLAPADDAPGVMLNAPVNLRSASLVVLAVLASLFVLHWARAVFLPLLLGLMFSYALTPLVNRLVRLHIPRTLAAAVLLMGIVGGTGWLGYSLSDDAAAMIETLPGVAHKLRRDRKSTRLNSSHSDLSRMPSSA